MDAAALQYENQKLVQQLEAQKSEMHILEGKFKELRNEQSSYDNTLIHLNKTWNQLIDDLVLLGVRVGVDLDNLQALDHEELSEESLESCPSEEIFLCMLLKSKNYRNNDDSSMLKFVEEALALRHRATAALMRSLQEGIAAQHARSESLSLALNGRKPNEDVIVALQNHNDHLKEVVANVHEAISIVNGKHKKYLDEIEALKNSYPKELEKIKRLSGLQVGWAGPARIATVRLLGMFISVRIRWDAIPQGYVGLAFSAHLYCIIPSTHISIFSDRICTGSTGIKMQEYTKWFHCIGREKAELQSPSSLDFSFLKSRQIVDPIYSLCS